jgi:squalene-hopene/tetraprenyl-beta-curcumene cyclase
MMNRLLASSIGCGLLVLAVQAADPKPAAPGKNRADEPMAKVASIDRAAAYLDVVATEWTTKHNCGTCHTNVPYLMARPALRGKMSAEEKAVRSFFEGRVANWDRGGKGDKPRWDTEVVVTGVTLAFHDAWTTGKLHPMTRKALDRMWILQMKNGAWNWLKCKWPPMEHDDYFGAVFAAVGVGLAPEGYASTEKAKAGLTKLRGYFAKTPAPTLHHKAWLLWASLKLDGLMSKEEQQQTIKELLARQKEDGGWSLSSLGDWQGYDGRENDVDAPSDGYGTGLVVYILRQAGHKADEAVVKKGVAWMKANQRVSGRWFTRSLNTDRAHYITNAGTAFALMALKACE